MGISKDVERQIDQAAEEFRRILIEQYERNEKIAAVAGAKACGGAAGKENGATDVKSIDDGTECPNGTAGKINDATEVNGMEACGAEACDAVCGAAVVVGLAPGDGIGPVIMEETKAVLGQLLAEELGAGRIELRDITGFTIEERLAAGETVPAEVIAQLEACDVLLKGPTTTPNAAMGGRNLESANVFLRKRFDLFANVRPVKIESKGIDWTFFRENTEGEYALGSKGIRIGYLARENTEGEYALGSKGIRIGYLAKENTEGEYALGSKGIRIGYLAKESGDNCSVAEAAGQNSFERQMESILTSRGLSVDFKVTTSEGSRRIAKAAFDFARENGKKRVSIVTKANIMKKTDGDFQAIALDVAKDYPEIKTDTWFVDIMAANLVNKDIRSGFEVFVLPNLYGDIITDEAAQIQGGVGTAGSANIGTDFAMFEAIHGSAPRMVEDGIAHLANPASLMTAAVMMLRHIGYAEKAARLEKAIAAADEKIGAEMTGLPGGRSCKEFADLVRAEL